MSEETDRFQVMESERNQRMMVLMTAMKDYIGAVTTEINELRNLLGISLAVARPPEAKPKAKPKAKSKKKTSKDLESTVD